MKGEIQKKSDQWWIEDRGVFKGGMADSNALMVGRRFGFFLFAEKLKFNGTNRNDVRLI
jgi:hypothetical protein